MPSNAIAQAEPAVAGAPVPGWHFFQPYADFDADFLYNALFCDSIALLRRDPTLRDDRWSCLLEAVADVERLRAIARDAAAPSRLRAVACHRLCLSGEVAPGSVVLGVIVEFPLTRRQETLAVFADGSVHYIRACGACRSFDGGSPEAQARARKLVDTAAAFAARLGPAPGRRPPPSGDQVRITVLTGGGPCCGDGRFAQLQRDPLAGAVLGRALRLLQTHALASAV